MPWTSVKKLFPTGNLQRITVLVLKSKERNSIRKLKFWTVVPPSLRFPDLKAGEEATHWLPFVCASESRCPVAHHVWLDQQSLQRSSQPPSWSHRSLRQCGTGQHLTTLGVRVLPHHLYHSRFLWVFIAEWNSTIEEALRSKSRTG